MSLSGFFIKIKDCPQNVLNSFSLRRYEPLRQKGEILLDSEKVIRRAFVHGLKFRAILGTESHLIRHESWLSALDSCDIYCAKESEIAEITGHRLHQGMIARAVKPRNRDLGELDGPILGLNAVLDAQNVGIIARSCLAFGISHLLVDETSCSPYVRRSLRVSMGSVFPLNIRESPNFLDDLRVLREKSYDIISLELSQDALPLPQHQFSDRSLLIVGNEDQGVSSTISELCHHKLMIRMSKNIDSLNVAQAATIALYAWQQQRGQ